MTFFLFSGVVLAQTVCPSCRQQQQHTIISLGTIKSVNKKDKHIGIQGLFLGQGLSLALD